MRKTFLTIITLLFSLRTFSHPVIYQEGWVLNSTNMSVYSNNYVMYSFTNKWALGLEHWRFTEEDLHNEQGLLKLNHLLYRHNGADSQGNIYLHGGVGVEDQEFQKKKTRFASMAGVEADWETRKIYTAAKYFKFNDISMTQGRIGFSPKEAPFDALQTWFILQGMVIEDVEDTVMITPLLRFFYHNVLWEVGSSTRGEWLLNLMVHY